MQPITFKGEVKKVSTDRDDGFILTIALPESEQVNAALLMAMRHEVVDVTVQTEDPANGEIK